jgi:pyridoxine 5-phosphate synthase
LDVLGQFGRVQEACARLAAAGCRVSLFIGPDPAQIEASARAGAPCIEIHTGTYAEAWWVQDRPAMQAELERIRQALRLGRSLGLRTHAGHGLAVWDRPPPHPGPSSTAAIAALPEVAELHIGHALIGHAVFVGLRQAIADFKAEAVRARQGA